MKSIISIIVLCLYMLGCRTVETREDYYNESNLASRGVRVSSQHGFTTWKIPITEVRSQDQKIGFSKLVEYYQRELNLVRAKLRSEGLNFPLPTIEQEDEFRDQAFESAQKVLESYNRRRGANSSGEEYDSLKEMGFGSSYLIPQALLFYIGGNVGGAAKLSLGGGATIFFVVRVMHRVVIEDATGTVVSKPDDWEIDGAIMGAPSASFGVGLGAGKTLIFGGGFVLGPVDDLSSIAGVAIGPAKRFSAIAGASASVHGVLRVPPLFYVTMGGRLGASAEVRLEFDTQVLMTFEQFVKTLKTATNN